MFTGPLMEHAANQADAFGDSKLADAIVVTATCMMWMQVSTARQAAGDEDDPAAVVGAAKGRLVRACICMGNI